jgi:hypothetical protein
VLSPKPARQIRFAGSESSSNGWAQAAAWCHTSGFALFTSPPLQRIVEANEHGPHGHEGIHLTNLPLCFQSHPQMDKVELISQRAHDAVAQFVTVAPIGDLSLKGFREPVLTFNVIGLK